MVRAGRGRVSRSTAVAAAVLGLAALVSSLTPAQGAEGVASLVDDGDGVALFDASVPLAPGHPRSACVSVAASGAGPRDAVVLAAVDVTGPLAAALTVEVRTGTGGGRGDCTGFVAEGRPVFTGTLAELAVSGGVATGWVPARAARRTFSFTVRLADDAVPGTRGSAVFAWRLVSGPVDPPPPTGPTGPPTAPPTTPGGGGGPGPTATRPPRPPATSRPTTTPTPRPTTPGPTPTGSRTQTPAPSPTTAPPPPDVDVGARPGPVARFAAQVGSFVARAVAPWLPPVLAERLGATITNTVSRPTLPLSVVLLALLFLAVQHRLDQRDPKLASAAVNRRATELEFPDLFAPGTDDPHAAGGAR